MFGSDPKKKRIAAWEERVKEAVRSGSYTGGWTSAYGDFSFSGKPRVYVNYNQYEQVTHVHVIRDLDISYLIGPIRSLKNRPPREVLLQDKKENVNKAVALLRSLVDAAIRRVVAEDEDALPGKFDVRVEIWEGTVWGI